MPTWQGKSRGNRTGYRIFVSILRTFGVKPAYWLLRLVSAYFFIFSFRSSRVIYRYFRRRLGYSPLKSVFSVYRNNYAFGQTIIDRVVMMSGIPNRFSFDFEGEPHLKELVSLGRGGLLLSAHIGNWEIAGHLLQRLDTRINIVMYDGEEQQIREYLEGITGERKAKIILIKDDLSHIYAISEAFKNNELVCIHADRFLQGNKTVAGTLLGKSARFPLGPFLLATSFKTPISFVFAMKETSLNYHFYATESRVYEDREKLLVDFIGEMEKTLKKYPVQWYNYYDFWQ
jgi:predicted LPLAT superfamily acyltransferase